MPRCHIRCNIITDPEKGGQKKLRPADIKPYLRGMFHVSVKEIYEVLGMSHHTLAPMRRDLGLSRWPFADICKGDFNMEGVRITWDDIENQRLSLMKDADERIVKILEVMGERAQKHKHRVNKKVQEIIHKSRKGKATTSALGSDEIQTEKPDNFEPNKQDSEPKMMVENLVLDSTRNEIDAEQVFAGDEYDWDGLSDLILRHLDAPEGTLFPSHEEAFE